MLKNFKKLLNLVITENIFKYTTEKYKEHIKKFPNIAHPAFDVIGPHISLFGRFEHNELKVLEERVFNKIDCSNSTCLDIGANIGNHSVFFANFFSNIYSFEPYPDSYYLLKFNSKNFNNIKTFNFGASDVDENQYMYIATDTDMGRNTLFIDRIEQKNNDQSHPKKIKVELWVLCLAGLLSLLLAIGTGILVRQELVGIKLGIASKTALFLAEIPSNLKTIGQGQSFDLRAGELR